MTGWPDACSEQTSQVHSQLLLFGHSCCLVSPPVCPSDQAYKMKGEEYRLFWSERPEFVRMAARYGATIVPFAGVGAEEGFQMLLDPEEVRRLPIVGSMIEQRSRSTVPQARRCEPALFLIPSHLLWLESKQCKWTPRGAAGASGTRRYCTCAKSDMGHILHRIGRTYPVIRMSIMNLHAVERV